MVSPIPSSLKATFAFEADRGGSGLSLFARKATRRGDRDAHKEPGARPCGVLGGGGRRLQFVAPRGEGSLQVRDHRGVELVGLVGGGLESLAHLARLVAG
jgi:hypothetical protein